MPDLVDVALLKEGTSCFARQLVSPVLIDLTGEPSGQAGFDIFRGTHVVNNGLSLRMQLQSKGFR